MKNTLRISPSGQFFIMQVTFILAMLSALSPLATDAYIPALDRMSTYFDVNFHSVELSVTIYFIGVAFGQFFGGPFSDSFGRKTVALTGVMLYGLASFAAIFSPSVQVLWVLRFVQAIGGGCASVVNMAYIRDWFEGKELARISSLMSMVMMLAPLFAPIIGTALLTTFGWKSIFCFLGLMASLVFIIFLVVMPESRPKGKMTKKINIKQIVDSYTQIFKNKSAGLLVMANSFAVSAMFTFIAGSSFMYIKFFGVPEADFPFYFGINVVANILVTLLNFLLIKKYAPKVMLNAGLVIQLITGFVIMFAVRQAEPSLYLVSFLMMTFVGSMGLVFSNITAIILNQFPDVAGSANATIGVVRFAMSGVVGSLLGAFATGDLVPLGTIMFTCTVTAYALYMLSKRFVVAQKSDVAQ